MTHNRICHSEKKNKKKEKSLCEKLYEQNFEKKEHCKLIRRSSVVSFHEFLRINYEKRKKPIYLIEIYYYIILRTI